VQQSFDKLVSKLEKLEIKLVHDNSARTERVEAVLLLIKEQQEMQAAVEADRALLRSLTVDDLALWQQIEQLEAAIESAHESSVAKLDQKLSKRTTELEQLMTSLTQQIDSLSALAQELLLHNSSSSNSSSNTI
jgi:hypothetical protein